MTTTSGQIHPFFVFRNGFWRGEGIASLGILKIVEILVSVPTTRLDAGGVGDSHCPPGPWP
jgi:hypothetical protein